MWDLDEARARDARLAILRGHYIPTNASQLDFNFTQGAPFSSIMLPMMFCSARADDLREAHRSRR
jgi:hypothetical protein